LPWNTDKISRKRGFLSVAGRVLQMTESSEKVVLPLLGGKKEKDL